MTRRLVLRRQSLRTFNDVAIESSHSARAYQEWRDKELRTQYCANFQTAELRGKAILDFGCGTGYLSEFAAAHGASSVLGIDLNQRDIDAARDRLLPESMESKISFEVALAPTRIDCDADRFDIILCFDVLEHIMECKQVFAECHRALKPNGHLYIWWQPYFHPWGHHLRARIPVPWAHVVFSNKTLAEVCKRIYEMSDYELMYSDVDEDGNKKPSKLADHKSLGGINMLSIRHFDRLFRDSGFSILRKEKHPFSGPAPIRYISKVLATLPFFSDFFSAFIIYELQATKTATGRTAFNPEEAVGEC